VKDEVKKTRMQFENELVEKANKNPKLLYKYLNSQKVVNDSIKAIRNSNKELTHDPDEIANTLKKYFQEAFVIKEAESPSFNVDLEVNVSDFVDMNPDEITYFLVASKLNKLNQNKTCGADKLHPKLLKKLCKRFCCATFSNI